MSILFYPQDKLAIFIDGQNVHHTSRNLGFSIDYNKLLDVFSQKSRLIHSFYYTVMMESRGSDEFTPLRPLVDWLSYNGFQVVTKLQSENSRRSVSVDLDIGIDMLRVAPSLDHILFFTGDSGFCRLVAAVQHYCRVTVVSSIRTSPSMIGEELRRQASNFLELSELKDVIGRD